MLGYIRLDHVILGSVMLDWFVQLGFY